MQVRHVDWCLVAVLFAVTTLSPVGAALYCAQELGTLEKSKNSQAESKKESGLTLTISVPAELKAGAHVPIQIKVCNGGSDMVRIGRSTSRPFPVNLELKTKDEKSVPLTRYGVKLLKPSEIGDILTTLDGSWRDHSLRPGQTEDRSIPNLALYYDLTVPGEYFLTIRDVVASEDRKNTIKLNAGPVKFRIVRP